MQSKRDNLCTTPAGLVAGGTSGTVGIGNNFSYQIGGRAYSKAAAASVALVAMAGTSALAVPANSTQVIFLHVDAAGNVVYTQNANQALASGINRGLATSATAPGYTPGAIEWPQETPGYAIIGAVKIATNASGAFTPGTTSLGAANQTVTYYNVTQDLGVCIPV